MMMDAERLDVLLAAARIDDIAARHPELFETKRRAPAIWGRAGCWSVGVLVGSIAEHFITGSTSHPVSMLVGMLGAATFVYFDPPPINTIRKLRASAIEARRAETENTGSVHESAVAKPDAQGAPA